MTSGTSASETTKDVTILLCRPIASARRPENTIKKSTRCVEHDGEAGYGDVLTCQDDIKGSGDSIHEACEEDTAARVGGIV